MIGRDVERGQPYEHERLPEIPGLLQRRCRRFCSCGILTNPPGPITCVYNLSILWREFWVENPVPNQRIPKSLTSLKSSICKPNGIKRLVDPCSFRYISEALTATDSTPAGNQLLSAISIHRWIRTKNPSQPSMLFTEVAQKSFSMPQLAEFRNSIARTPSGGSVTINPMP